MRIALALLAVFSISCTKTIMRPGPGITWDHGRLLYEGKRFDGVVREYFDQVGTFRDTRYRGGLPNGTQTETNKYTYEPVARGEFKDGIKVGVHEGWFTGGARRFHFEYDHKGESHGEFWEWHATGHPSLFARYEHGKMIGKKMWRDDGQIYMNWVFTDDDQAIGTPGTKLCFQLRNEGIGTQSAIQIDR